MAPKVLRGKARREATVVKVKAAAKAAASKGVAASGDFVYTMHDDSHGALLKQFGLEEPQGGMQRRQDVTESACACRYYCIQGSRYTKIQFFGCTNSAVAVTTL